MAMKLALPFTSTASPTSPVVVFFTTIRSACVALKAMFACEVRAVSSYSTYTPAAAAAVGSEELRLEPHLSKMLLKRALQQKHEAGAHEQNEEILELSER